MALIVLGAGVTGLTDENPCPHRVYILMKGGEGNTHTISEV